MIAVVVGIALRHVLLSQQVETMLAVPFTQQLIPLGSFFIPWVALVFVGTSNAVNLTDEFGFR